MPSVLNIGRLTKILVSIEEGIIKKKFLWESRLWVGRRLEPILGYVPKNDETNNPVHKGLKNWNLSNFFNPLLPSVPNIGRLTKILISIKEGIIKKNFLWASRLWVGRRLEPILGNVPKNDEKNNPVHKGLSIITVADITRCCNDYCLIF